MWLENSKQFLATASRLLKVSGWMLLPLYLLIVIALWGAFLYAPLPDRPGADPAAIQALGDVQRIFYFHVSSAMNSFLAFFLVFIGGVAYLVTRNEKWDAISAASAEVGIFLTTIVLTTGPIWAKPEWNTWFPWGDPRVMTELVLLLIFIAYFILRASLPEGEKKYKFAAVCGIIGFLDVPIVYLSIHLLRTLHPVVITATEIRLDPMIRQAWLMALVAIMVLTVVLVLLRTSMRLHHRAAQEMRQQLRERRARAA